MLLPPYIIVTFSTKKKIQETPYVSTQKHVFTSSVYIFGFRKTTYIRFEINCVQLLHDLVDRMTSCTSVKRPRDLSFTKIVPKKIARRGNWRASALRTWQPLPPLRTSPPDRWSGKNGGAPSESLAARVSRSPGPVGALRVARNVEDHVFSSRT